MGHATRCIPIIQQHVDRGDNVIIAADKHPLSLLQQEFPKLKTILFRGYEINYPKNRRMAFKMLLESPKIIKRIKEEHLELEKMITEHQIDLVISDNRYGLWSKNIPCFFITHQVFIKAPLGERILENITKRYIDKFTQCWIPDYEGDNNLSGDLTHKSQLDKRKYHFIGPLSRFSLLQKKQNKPIKEYKYDVLVIISGPEPQRTIFEEMIIKQLKNTKLKGVIVRGVPNQKSKIKNQILKIFNHLPTKELYQYITKSRVVVCRAGYSSIMDLVVLNKQAILIPTPGQTEQEYLAKYHFKKGNFYVQNQRAFNLKKALLAINNKQ